MSLCLTKYQALKYGGMDVYLHTFLISVPGGGEWSASRIQLCRTEIKNKFEMFRIKSCPEILWNVSILPQNYVTS